MDDHSCRFQITDPPSRVEGIVNLVVKNSTGLSIPIVVGVNIKGDSQRFIFINLRPDMSKILFLVVLKGRHLLMILEGLSVKWVNMFF